MTQVRPDELIRILRAELEAIGAGLVLLGYDENGAFAGGQAVAGANSIGMGDTTTVGGDYAIVGGGQNNSAAGDYSVIGGGYNNTISHVDSWCSTISGGEQNVISSQQLRNSIGGGYKNIISDQSSQTIAGGRENEITSSDAANIIGGGLRNLIDGDAGQSFIGGGLKNTITSAEKGVICGGSYNNIVIDAQHSAIPGGYYSKADKYGQVVTASGRFAAVGDAQGTIQMVVSIARATHVVNTWYALYPNQVAANRVTIAADTAWTIHCLVVGITQNTAQQWGYELIGLIERDNAGNTTLAGQTLRTIFESDGNYIAQLAADDANEALEVQVRRTGGADYNVRWVATIRMAEVTYP